MKDQGGPITMMSALSANYAAISSLTAASYASAAPAVVQAVATPVNDRTTQQDSATISDAAMAAYRSYQASSDGDNDGS
jgi:hypothetical protein